MSGALGGVPAPRALRRGLLLLVLAGLLVAVSAGHCAAVKALALAKAYPNWYVSDEIYYVDTARKLLIEVFNYKGSFFEWSGKTREGYYNLEHPPLGKYIIALSMLLCGDQPLCWRLPGIVEALLIPVVLYAGFAWAYARTREPLFLLGGLVAALAAGGDRILYRDASVAMLDIHLALFTSVFAALALNGKVRASLVAGSLATMVKMSGVATLGAVVLLSVGDSLRKRSPRPLAWAIVWSAIILLTVGSIVYLPLIAYFGPERIVEETISALGWHTTSRPQGPPTSTPLGWILNSNPFAFSYAMVDARAVTTTVIHLAALLASAGLFTAYIACGLKRLECPLPPVGSTLYVSTLLMYALIWAMGNHTFYSFYAVQLTPAAGVTLGEALVYLAFLARGTTVPVVVRGLGGSGDVGGDAPPE